MTLNENGQGGVKVRVREFGGVPIPELYPQGGRVFSIQIEGQSRLQQFAIPIEVVKTYHKMVREAARSRRVYWVDLNAPEVFDCLGDGFDDSVPLRFLRAIHNDQVIAEDESP